MFGQTRAYAICLALCSSVWSSFGSAAMTASEIVEANRDALVFIESTATEPSGKPTTETGTGFIVSTKGYILTANHLLSANPEAKLVAHIRSKYASPISVQRLAIPGCCDL